MQSELGSVLGVLRTCQSSVHAAHERRCVGHVLLLRRPDCRMQRAEGRASRHSVRFCEAQRLLRRQVGRLIDHVRPVHVRELLSMLPVEIPTLCVVHRVVSDLVRRVHVTGNRCLRPRDVFTDLLPRRGVLSHHVILLRTQRVSILQSQGTLVFTHQLQLRLHIRGSYTLARTRRPRIQTVPLRLLPTNQPRQPRRIRSNAIIKHLILIDSLKMLLDLLIQLLLVHVDNGVVGIELVKNV